VVSGTQEVVVPELTSGMLYTTPVGAAVVAIALQITGEEGKKSRNLEERGRSILIAGDVTLLGANCLVGQVYAAQPSFAGLWN
jgi:hypothetical protein